MIKNCTLCQKPFKTHDSRYKTCSKKCARRARIITTHLRTVAEKPTLAGAVRTSLDLPPVEELPAPYAKRVHDMWAALTGDAPTRIA